MNRRQVIIGTLCASAALTGIAGATEVTTLEYDDSDPITTALEAGDTVLVVFGAKWCSTCASQERTMNALRAENTAYDENIVFVRVDWDQYGNAPVATSRNIPRRSTLIVLKGDEEKGRIVAGTSKAAIQELMDTALAVATTS